MGIFTRFRDIVNSNINSMLDKAEDPEKLIKLMIQEMEETLIEIKASCSGAMASAKKTKRRLDETAAKVDQWAQRAELAVQKGREDLAREALAEKRALAERVDLLGSEYQRAEALVDEYQADIVQLEEKLASVREKQRNLVQRHIHARRKRKAQEDIRRFETSEALARFESLENRIERMESDADLVNYGRQPSLEERFARLAGDEEIERELAALKAAQAGSAGKTEKAVEPKAVPEEAENQAGPEKA